MKISGWDFGSATTHDLVAGLLPASEMSFLVVPNEDERRVVVADIAVAIAAGPMAREVVQEAKKVDGYRLSSGFLGLDVGEQRGVAIVGAARAACESLALPASHNRLA